MFRTNFVLCWLAANMGYYILIAQLVNSSSGSQVGDVVDSDDGYLTYFSIYLAALVIFRVTFSVLYILMWKFRYNCQSRYKVQERDLTLEVKRIKKTNENGESTDDEEINAELDKFYEQNKDDISKKLCESMGDRNYDTSVHDATLNFIGRKKIEDEEKEHDPDYDFKEFGGAEVEEAEDRIYSEYKRR